MEPEYRYRAKVIRVYDADTIYVDLDLGCKVIMANEPLRLARVDAWEVRGEERQKGLDARKFVENALLNDRADDDASIVVETQLDKKGKYGRLIAEVWYPIGQSRDVWMNLSDELVRYGHAEYVEY